MCGKTKEPSSGPQSFSSSPTLQQQLQQPLQPPLQPPLPPPPSSQPPAAMVDGERVNVSSPDREIIDENCAGNFIFSATNKRNSSHHHRYQLGTSEPTNNCDSLQERRLRQLRRQADWQWLHACIGANLLFSNISPDNF